MLPVAGAGTEQAGIRTGLGARILGATFVAIVLRQPGILGRGACMARGLDRVQVAVQVAVVVQGASGATRRVPTPSGRRSARAPDFLSSPNSAFDLQRHGCGCG